ncbi:MAG: universal stress protein [Candidatus Pacebacteria bacterium]|nr:universal stress protein [Candidatus Paceibacterota bacterium]
MQAACILAEAAKYDLIVIGATGHHRLQTFAFSALPDALAQRLDTPLVMVKAKTPVKSLVDRWM